MFPSTKKLEVLVHIEWAKSIDPGKKLTLFKARKVWSTWTNLYKEIKKKHWTAKFESFKRQSQLDNVLNP